MALFRSLRWRLALLYALVIVAALAVVLTLVEALVERALIESTAARLEVEAGLISPAGTGGGDAPATTLSATDLARALGGQETAVVIVDASGMALAVEANAAPADVVAARLDPASYRRVLADSTIAEAVLPVNEARAERVLVVAAPISFTSPSTAKATATPAATPARTPAPAPAVRPGPPSSVPGQGKGLGRSQGVGGSQGVGRGLTNGGTGGGGGSGTASIPTGPPNSIAQLAVSLEEIDLTLAALRQTLLGVGLVALAAALLLALLVTALGLRPLARMAAVADRVAAGDLSARVRLPSGHDEVGRLGRAFDRMVERLEGAFAAQRQFAADASHELRSPLTVLGGYVDVLAQGKPDAPETAGRILGSMRREIDRLSRLAADLLLLTQLEAGGGRLVPEALDLGDLLADLGEAARVIGRERRVVVERDGAMPVVADRDRLTQALLNLVDNAIRHTPEGGIVRLASRREDRSAVAEVFNEGPPIPPEHLPHLFDRFYRADRSAEPGRHAGLGLAIVKAIVDASGGTVSAASDASGTRFLVRLPLAPQRASQVPLSRHTGLPQDAAVR